MAFSIGGTPVPAPTDIQPLSNNIGPYGSNLIQTGITFLLIAAVLLALVFIILGGIKWVMAGGEKQKIEEARVQLTYSIIGLVIAFMAFAIISLVGTFFHVSLF